MSTKLIELFGSLQSEEEKQDFLEAQFAVVTSLTKQVNQLKEEKKHLEQLLKSVTPSVIQKDEDTTPNEEKIAKEQLRHFKSVSDDRELTLEETRKVEIYSKILLANKDKKIKEVSPVAGMSTGELLKIVQDEAN